MAFATLIAGPTASGKSALAIALAKQAGGTVLNADSMQVYADLRVLSARPTPDDEACVPHRLFGFVASDEEYSVGRYTADVARLIAEARAAGQPLVIVGGTGLYFRALTEGLMPSPPIDPKVREEWRERAAKGRISTRHFCCVIRCAPRLFIRRIHRACCARSNSLKARGGPTRIG